MQTPCIRLVATILSLVLYFEFHDGSFIALKILDFISLPSLLIGIYGCHILVSTVSKLVSQTKYTQNYVNHDRSDFRMNFAPIDISTYLGFSTFSVFFDTYILDSH